MDTYRYRYQIGPCQISISSEQPLIEEEKYSAFKVEEGEEALSSTVTFKSCRELITDFEDSDMVQEDDSVFSEYHEGKKWIRTFHSLGDKKPYAVWRQEDDSIYVCEYNSEKSGCFATVDGCIQHSALERILMEQSCTILHASLIRTDMGGILFSGPSGIGKSTQAELWRKYQNADILNGDRTILKREEDGWRAYGSPFAGSSQIYRNEWTKVKAIVLLDKAQENEGVRIYGAEALRHIYKQITMNGWNSSYAERALSMLVMLSREIPVYRYACRPDREAVEVLKGILKKEETEN